MRAAASIVVLIAVGCTGEVGTFPGAPDPNPSSGGSNETGTGAPTGTGESPSPRLLRQLTLSEYHDTVADLLKITDPDTTNVPPDVPVRGYTTNATSRFVDPNNIDKYALVATNLADRAVTESYNAVGPCHTEDSACAATFVRTFGLRAFRRPLTADEQARYAAFFAADLTGGDFKTGVSLVIRTMLLSPYFLMRSELGAETRNGVFALTPFEVATALSYTYWGSMPDDALFNSAQSGALASKKEIEAQARRLLAAPRGRARVATFVSEWMEASRAYVANKDPATFPALKDAATTVQIVDAMKAEEDAFITNIAFDSSKKFSELFSADYTFVNDRLAAFYGLPAPGSGEMVSKVTLGPGSARGGLLTTGMFLFGHARTNQSSPTQRGHVIRANILCSDVPPPPPGVDATVKPGTPGKTGREQIEALTGSGTCSACHSLMNPIGYGREGFDGAGLLRTMDNGEVVDTSGAINGLGSSGPIAFHGAKELSAIIAKDPSAQACFAANYYRFTRGFDPAQTNTPADATAVDQLGKAFVKDNLDLPELFVQIALQDSFTVRRSVEALSR